MTPGEWRNGIRAGLKIRCSNERAGSKPVSPIGDGVPVRESAGTRKSHRLTAGKDRQLAAKPNGERHCAASE